MLRVLEGKSSAAAGRGSAMPARKTPSCGSGPTGGLETFAAKVRRLNAMTSARRPVGAHKSASPTSTGSPRRPEPRQGRRRARFSLLPVLALLLAALSPFAAAPASAAKLLGNTDQGTLGAGHDLSVSFPFTTLPFGTGSNPSGYRLDSAAVRFGAVDPLAGVEIAAEIWSDSGGNPGQKVVDLTVSQPLARFSYNTFRAPSGTVLAAGTTYHLVVRLVAGNVVGFTATQCCDPANHLDGDSAPGWTIKPRRISKDGTSWTLHVGSRAAWFRIDGEVNPWSEGGLRVTPGDRRLTLRWTAPALPGDTGLRGYDVWYREAVCTQPKRWNAGSSSNPDWVPEFRDGVRVYELCDSANPNQPGPWVHHGAWAGSWDPIARQTTRVIDGLWPGVAYDVRVRVRTSKGDLPWILARGTPSGGSSNARLLQIELIAEQLQP